MVCTLCGQQFEKEIYKNSLMRVVICTRCGFSYLNPRMSSEEYTDYYKNEYQAKRHLLNGYERAIERLIKKGSYEQKKKHLPIFKDIISKKTRVLEIGSGWGTLLKVLQDAYGCSVQGLEISSLAVQVAKNYYKLPIVESTLEAYVSSKKPEEKYDLIIMHHVLEHFLDPRMILNTLQTFLSKEGLVYIALPDLENPDEAIEKFFRIDHCSYFYPETLSVLLQQCGYKIVRFTRGPTDMKFVVAKLDSVLPEVVVPKTNLGQVVRRIQYRRVFEGIKEKIKITLGLFKR